MRISGETTVAQVSFYPCYFCCFNNCLLVINVVIKKAAVGDDTDINRNFCSSRQTYAAG